jgi:hypothetical protein
MKDSWPSTKIKNANNVIKEIQITPIEKLHIQSK